MGRKTFTRLRYQVGDTLADGLLVLSVWVFRGLSMNTMAAMAKGIGILAFHGFKKYRNRVLDNLSVALGLERDSSEIRRLAREVFFHFSLTPLETIYLAANGLPFERFVLRIRIEGKEHLDAALAKGRGVIALGAHLGSFTLLGSRLAVEGYPLNIMINQGNFQKTWRRLNAYQGIVDQKVFPPRPASASIKKSLNCLHRNEILYLIADEQQRRGGLPVPFFGQVAFTPPGPAIFSLKTGAPLLPMFVLRGKDNQRTLVIGKPIEIERSSDEKKDIERLTAAFTKVIEDEVRGYPSQWAWLNRRWKLPYRPEKG